MTLIASITSMGSVKGQKVSKSVVSSNSSSGFSMEGVNGDASLVNLDIWASILGIIGIKVKANVL